MGNAQSINLGINLNLPTLNLRRPRSNSVPNLAQAESASRTTRKSRSRSKGARRLKIRKPFGHNDDEEDDYDDDDSVEGTGAATAGAGSDDEAEELREAKDEEAPPPMPILDKAEREVRRLKMLRETLGPVQSQEEFCKRFNVGEAQYRASRDVFQELAGDKDFVTDQEWMEDAPQTEAAQQWVRNIWRAFAPADNKMTLSDWLVFDGIRKYGTLDQRVIGSFVLYDHNADGVLQREEVAAMMRTAAAVAGEGISESLIQQALELLMQAADKNHTGFMQLDDILSAARVNPTLAKIFNAV